MTIVYKAKKTKYATLKDICRTMGQNTGIPYEESYAAATAYCDAVRYFLHLGIPVRVDKFGTWEFRYRKARTTKWTRGIQAGKVRSQPDRWVVRFAPSAGLKAIANHEAPPQAPSWNNGHTFPVKLKPIAEIRKKSPNQKGNANLRPWERKNPPSTPAQKAPDKA